MDSIETAVQGVKEGKVQLFEKVVEYFQQPLFRYCYRMLGNIQEAEDAVQEVFLKAFDKIGSYSKSISFSAWLYKIAYNHCVNIIRRRNLFRFVAFSETSLSDTGDVGITYEEKEINKELKLVLSKLSSADRCILILKNVEGKSFEEIAPIMNIKPAAIRKRYERLRKKLKVSLSNIKGGMVNENYSVNG